jgi:autotransporter-associated beta strand protein
LNGLGTIYFLGSGASSSNLVFTRDTNIRTVFAIFKGSSFLLTDGSAFHFHRPTDNDPTSPLWNANTSGNIRGGTTYVNQVQVDGSTYAMPTNINNGFNLVTVLATNSVTAGSFNRDRTSHSGNQAFGEVIIYDVPLSDANRQVNEAYLMYKWFGIGGLSNILPVATAVQIAGGATLDLGGVEQTIGSLAGDGIVTNNSATPITFTIAPAAGSTTFAGSIVDSAGSDAISLRKLGAGTQILAGTNTFSGATLIQAGTLAINGYLQNSPVTVTAGGTLAGDGTIGSSVTVDGGGLSPGNSTGTLTVASLTLTNNPLLYFELGPTNASDLVIVNNTLSLEGMATNWFVLSAVDGFDVGTYTLFQVGSIQGQLGSATNFTSIAGREGYLFLEGNNVRLEVIPEPGAASLVAGGLALLFLLRRRRS